MAPKKTAKASNSQAKPDITHSDATGMDASQSQDIDTKSLQDLLSKHKQQVKQRKQKRREVIVTAHNSRIADLTSQIDQAFKKHDEKLRTLRRPKIERMLKLVQKKSELKDKIDECASQMEDLYLTTSEKIQIAVDGRLESVST